MMKFAIAWAGGVGGRDLSLVRGLILNPNFLCSLCLTFTVTVFGAFTLDANHSCHTPCWTGKNLSKLPSLHFINPANMFNSTLVCSFIFIEVTGQLRCKWDIMIASLNLQREDKLRHKSTLTKRATIC